MRTCCDPLVFGDQSGIPGVIQASTGREIDSGAKLTKKERSEILGDRALDFAEFGFMGATFLRSVGAPRIKRPGVGDVVSTKSFVGKGQAGGGGPDGFFAYIATGDTDCSNANMSTAAYLGMNPTIMPSKGLLKGWKNVDVATQGVGVGAKGNGVHALENSDQLLWLGMVDAIGALG